MNLPIQMVNLPDCTTPYHVEPIIANACAWLALVVILCVTGLVYKWLDERGRK